MESVTPTGAMVQVTGANGQGKTSVLSSIELALDAAGAELQQPIRKGQKVARILTKLGTDADGVKYIVERRITDKGSYLHVSAPDGAQYRSPQALLNGLVGRLSFDPLEFMLEKPAAQFATLRRIVQIPVDLEALDVERAKHYDKRTEVNRTVKALAVQAASIIVPEGLPETPPDRAGILKRLQDVDNHNAAARHQAYQRDALKDAIGHCSQARSKLVEQRELILARHRRELEDIDVQVARAALAHDAAIAQEAEHALREVIPLQDPVAITAELTAADDLIRAQQRKNSKAALETELADEQKESDRLTAAIEAIDKQKADAIAATVMPIEGLSFADNVVLFNGIPLSQASSAEQLRVSAAIGAALNPKLRVMLARDGSLLDSKSLAMLGEFAEKNDFQIWVERVDESGTVGVVIEDGHVKGQESMALEFEKQAEGEAV